MLIIDIDDSIGEVYGYDGAVAAYGYTHMLGYHLMLAPRADTGEVRHCGPGMSANTARGAQRFVRLSGMGNNRWSHISLTERGAGPTGSVEVHNIY